jgi:multimeric flavodoxin WrbA
MKVVAFNGSPRKEGNTSLLINQVLGRIEETGIAVETINIAGQIKRGCTACGKCIENQNKRCVFDDDIINECIAKMLEADGIIIGSPTYFAAMTAETKALIDRAGYVVKRNGYLLRRKVGAAVTVARRAGSINVFQGINNFFFINSMIVPGSIYWNLGIGWEVGDVEFDEEGFQIMRELGDNMAWLIKKTKQ